MFFLFALGVFLLPAPLWLYDQGFKLADASLYDLGVVDVYQSPQLLQERLPVVCFLELCGIG